MSTNLSTSYQIIDGKKVSETIKEKVSQEVIALKKQGGKRLIWLLYLWVQMVLVKRM